MDVYLVDGKVVLVDGEVGTSTDCCCTPTIGACCEFDGSCNDVPDYLCGDCTIGVSSCFLGFGTLCATSRCEGACCCFGGGAGVGWLLHGTCALLGCDSGGVCLGEHMTYDECQAACLGPPPPPCCPGAFSAFDGSGRMFLTKTEHLTRTAHSDVVSGSDGCNYSRDTTKTTTISPTDCSTTVSCTGTSHYENAAHPDLEFADCVYVDDGAGGCHFVLTANAGGIGCGSGCVEFTGDCSTTTSATEEQVTCHFADLHNTADMVTTTTLSDECTP